MSTLQTFLIGNRPPLLRYNLRPCSCGLCPSKLQFGSVSIAAIRVEVKKNVYCSRRVISFALNSDTVNSSPDAVLGGNELEGNQKVGDFANGEEVGSDGEVREGVGDNVGLVAEEEKKSWMRIPLMVFLVGVWVRIKKGMEAVLALERMSWWPFGQKEKRLEWLIAEAEANPLDAEKQSALLVELNKHRKCF